MTYTFDELSDAAKQRAIDKYSDTNDDGWWHPVYERAMKDGEARGFDIDDIRFSGFWSQGDGASWTGRANVVRYIDWKLGDMPPDDKRFGAWTVLREIADNDFLLTCVDLNRGGGMYVHENTMQATAHNEDSVYTNPEDWLDTTQLNHGVLAGAQLKTLLEAFDFADVIDRLIEDLLDDAKAYAKEIYAWLEDQYNDLNSVPYFLGVAQANDWRFDEDGNII